MPVLKTFTLFLRDGGDGPPPFEPALCASEIEAVGKAHEALERHPNCHTVDVFFGDTELFSVRRSAD